MGIRETLNKNPAITTGATIVIILAALGFITYQIGHKNMPKLATGLYYTDDDGQTFFIDSMKQIPPFDHGGKEAVLANCYQCGEGKMFVGYLQKYTDEMAATLRDPNHGEVNTDPDTLVKRPGDTEWVVITSAKGREVTHVTCPPGTSGRPVRVVPMP